MLISNRLIVRRRVSADR